MPRQVLPEKSPCAGPGQPEIKLKKMGRRARLSSVAKSLAESRRGAGAACTLIRNFSCEPAHLQGHWVARGYGRIFVCLPELLACLYRHRVCARWAGDSGHRAPVSLGG